MEEEDPDLGDIILDNDYESEEEEDGPWFSMGMTKEEKREARKPWRLSLIIELGGRKIGYQFLLRRLQALWKRQHEFALIDLCNDFFIARFSHKQDYEVASLNVQIMISVCTCDDGSLISCRNLQKLNLFGCGSDFSFFQWSTTCTKAWKSKRTIKVDRTTLMASRGNIARVCAEVDLTRPLKGVTNLEAWYVKVNTRDSTNSFLTAADMDTDP